MDPDVCEKLIGRSKRCCAKIIVDMLRHHKSSLDAFLTNIQPQICNRDVEDLLEIASYYRHQHTIEYLLDRYTRYKFSSHVYNYLLGDNRIDIKYLKKYISGRVLAAYSLDVWSTAKIDRIMAVIDYLSNQRHQRHVDVVLTFTMKPIILKCYCKIIVRSGINRYDVQKFINITLHCNGKHKLQRLYETTVHTLAREHADLIYKLLKQISGSSRKKRLYQRLIYKIIPLCTVKTLQRYPHDVVIDLCHYRLLGVVDVQSLISPLLYQIDICLHFDVYEFYPIVFDMYSRGYSVFKSFNKDDYSALIRFAELALAVQCDYHAVRLLKHRAFRKQIEREYRFGRTRDIVLRVLEI